MKFIDINREFTAAANSYMAQGYYINAGTMGGSQGEVAHIDLTNGTEIIRVLLTTFNNYLGTEGVELIVGRVKDDIKPNQEDRWNTVWNERLEVISNKKFYRLNNRAQDGFYGTEEEANAAEEKRFDRYKSRRSNDSAVDVTTKAAPMVKKYIHEKFGVRRVKISARPSTTLLMLSASEPAQPATHWTGFWMTSTPSTRASRPQWRTPARRSQTTTPASASPARSFRKSPSKPSK